MITIVTLTTLAVTALLVALAVVSLLPDEEPQPDAETHDDGEPQRDPWAPVSPVTVENFGKGTLPARVITTHQERVYDLYGKHEQH